MVALVAVVATVPLLMWNVLPMYVVAMLMVISIVLPGVATPAQALAGFSFPSWLMIVALFTVTAAVARSGLLHRLSLLSSERLPANHLIQSLLLSLCGIVLAAGVTGGAPRIALGVPVAQALGIDPFVPAMAALIAGSHTIVPYVNINHATLYAVTGGDLFTHRQARPFLWLEGGFRLVAVLLAVPHWRLVGLM